MKNIKKTILYKALLTRFAEEALLDLFSDGKLSGTVHTSIGQELVGAVVTEFLREHDTIFSNHRCHGHFLSKNGDVDGLVAEVMGRASGVCAGYGGSQHLFKDGFYSNGIQGGIVPIAAGLAWAHKLENLGNISVVFIGDGTLGEGALYETLNIASKWRLPLLIVLENNRYSQSTKQEETLAGNICQRFSAFGIDGAVANTWDVEGLEGIASNLIEKIRNDSSPRFIQIDTYRLKAHSKGDDNREKQEIDSYLEKDLISQYLKDVPKEDKNWVDNIRTLVSDAIAKAERSEYAFSTLEDTTIEVAKKIEFTEYKISDEKIRYVNKINAALKKILGEQKSLFILGEDVLSPYGGAFKVTKDISDLYPDQIKNTPISESAIVGISAGLSLTKYRAIVEIMFGDFLTLGFDQLLNHASKFHHMYNKQVSCGLIVRTPMGGGRGYGPTHSQSLEKHFLGIPGLQVLALNIFVDPEEVLNAIINQYRNMPTLLIENKAMYADWYCPKIKEGFQLLKSSQEIPDILIEPDSDSIDITFIAYGGTVKLIKEACEKLFFDYDLICQALLVTKIYPFNISPYLAKIQRSKKIILFEEGQGFAGFASEVISQLAEYGSLDKVKVKRVFAKEICIPSSGVLEKKVLPDLQDLINAAID